MYVHETATPLSWTRHQRDLYGGDDESASEAMVQSPLQESDYEDVCDSVHAWRSYHVHGHWGRARRRCSHVHGPHDVSFAECDGRGSRAGEAGHRNSCALWCDDALGAARCGTRDGGRSRGGSTPSRDDRVVPGGRDHVVGARDAPHDAVVLVPLRTEDSLCVDDRDGLLLGERVPCGGDLHGGRHEGGTSPFAGAPPHGEDHEKMDHAPFAHMFQSRRQWATLGGSYS